MGSEDNSGLQFSATRSMRATAHSVTGGKSGTVVLDVQEHVECHCVHDPVTQRPGNVVASIAVMVHGPYREECSQAVATPWQLRDT